MYTLKKIITEENATLGFQFGVKWYNMDSDFCPIHTNINNTKDLKKAVKFETFEEAEKHMNFWFNENTYKIIKLKKKVK